MPGFRFAARRVNSTDAQTMQPPCPKPESTLLVCRMRFTGSGRSRLDCNRPQNLISTGETNPPTTITIRAEKRYLIIIPFTRGPGQPLQRAALFKGQSSHMPVPPPCRARDTGASVFPSRPLAYASDLVLDCVSTGATSKKAEEHCRLRPGCEDGASTHPTRVSNIDRSKAPPPTK